MNAAAPRPLWKRLGASFLRMALALILLLHGYLYTAQDQMIFYPRPLGEDVRRSVLQARPDAAEIELATADGQRLHGWFVRNTEAPIAPALIYFGGNAEEVSGFALKAPELAGISIALFNYRGYGKSTGDLGEAALFADAVAIYDLVASRPDVDRTRIVAMGRSLGSGVATYLASKRPLAAVVLVSPYDSISAVAQAMYPFVAVDLLLKHPFDSVSRAGSIDVPLLALIAGADTIIPPRHSERLASAWRGPATTLVLEGSGHNDLHAHARYWTGIREFLKQNAIPADKTRSEE